MLLTDDIDYVAQVLLVIGLLLYRTCITCHWFIIILHLDYLSLVFYYITHVLLVISSLLCCICIACRHFIIMLHLYYLSLFHYYVVLVLLVIILLLCCACITCHYFTINNNPNKTECLLFNFRNMNPQVININLDSDVISPSYSAKNLGVFFTLICNLIIIFYLSLNLVLCNFVIFTVFVRKYLKLLPSYLLTHLYILA